MSVEDNKVLAERFVEEVFNQGRIETVDELVSEQFVRHGLGRMTRGRQVIKDYVPVIRSAFPDFHVTIEDALGEGDKVAHRQTHTGTHLGEFAGVAATGRRMETTEISILRIEGGKIAEAWVNVDQLIILRQIGVLPEDS
jgi:steroid delta-isomerase-like uncharacterized protein